ncbi:MAG: chloride channel protein [Deltaproteobacteria bacterium]|nr:chloride channel protein [Deltaproteobacteria bacterium]
MESGARRSEGWYPGMILWGTVLGLAGAVGAVAFRVLIRFFQALFFEGTEGVAAFWEAGLLADPVDPTETARALPVGWLLFIPSLGGLIVGVLITFLGRESRGPGVPEVMEAVALNGGSMRRRVLGLKTLTAAITIGSGGSAGREGPIVQIGAALASQLGRFLKTPPRQLRTMVGCGAAAGIAATFNAPIAGALFAVEIILGDFAVASFTPIVIASVVATVASRGVLGNHPAFEVPLYEIVSGMELLAYAGIGVVTGAVAVLFTRSLGWSEDLFARLPVPEFARAAVGGLCIGALALAVPEILGVGYGTIRGALGAEIAIGSLALLLVAKLLATAITIGSGGSGGVFAPSLFLGAAVGGLLGGGLELLFPGAVGSSGAYALVTMGAMVAATTHAPITAIIMIFELTQSIEVIPPLMAACVLSSLVASRLYPDSIYTQKLRRRGVDLARDDDPNVLKTLYVRDLLDREPEVVPAAASFDEVIDRIVNSEHSELFVVNDGRLVGSIYLREVRRLLKEQEGLRAIVVAADLVQDSLQVDEDDDLDAAMHLFSRGITDELAVVDPKDPAKLVGSLRQPDVIAAYNQEVLRRDLAAGISNRISLAGEHTVDLGGHYVLQERRAPPSFVGKTIKEMDVRRRSGVQILLVRSAGRKGRIRVPGPDDRVEAGDHLVIAGPRAAVEELGSF